MSEDNDKLSKSIENQLVTKAPFPYTMTQAQEEVIYGEKKPKDRAGRLPIFYRNEVEEIRSAVLPIVVIAEQWGVSTETIKRVLQVGCYEDVPYIPRDEVDRRITYYTSGRKVNVQASMGETIKAKREERMKQGRGRNFKSGRGDLTTQERKRIANDIRSAGEVAEAFGISVPYVYKIRREFETTIRRSRPVTAAIIRDIVADTRPIHQIADERRIPKQVVLAIKEGKFKV